MIKPEKNVSIAPYTHYQIGGIAREAYFPVNAFEFNELLKLFVDNNIDYYILGSGSNVLIGDGYWNGAVIITTDMKSYEIFNDHISCGAGMFSSNIAEIALEKSKTGLEFLYLLPGSIGGALAGNARYDYTNVSDVLKCFTAIHPDKDIKTFASEEVDFTYKRNSIIQEGWYICEVSLNWKDGDPAVIEQRMNDIEKARKETQQFDFPSCGCIFINDHEKNIQAGRLIDSLGLKGLTVGGAQVAPFHANFIINTGNATARDVLNLIEKLEDIIFEKTGIKLVREVLCSEILEKINNMSQ